jgi:hypothetical protein
MCVAIMITDPWILPTVCLATLSVIALFAFKTDPTFAMAFRRWRQRQILRTLKKQLPTQLKKDKQHLCAAWDANPAAQCAAIFDRFKHPPKKVELEQLADDIDSAIETACRLFDDDFVSRYADVYSKLLVVRTAQIANALAAQQPANADFVIQKLTQRDDEVLRGFDASIRHALAEGRKDYELIRAHLEQLRENSGRFRRILTPGFFSKIGNILVGAVTGGLLGWMGTSSGFVISKSARFTAGKWADWRGKADEEFAEKFVAAVYELPTVCGHMDATVRRSVTDQLDLYLQHRLEHRRATLETLFELSRAGWDVGPSIEYFRDSR